MRLFFEVSTSDVWASASKISVMRVAFRGLLVVPSIE